MTVQMKRLRGKAAKYLARMERDEQYALDMHRATCEYHARSWMRHNVDAASRYCVSLDSDGKPLYAIN